MHIAEAQREMRVRFAGGFYGQAVSAVLWLASAVLATWSTHAAAAVLFLFAAAGRMTVRAEPDRV